MNEKDNLKILKAHYTTIFNRKVPTDLSMLDKIKPMHMVEELGKAPTKDEIIVSVNSMKNNKAPGISVLTTNMLKSLPPEGLDLFMEVIQDFWSKKDINYESWHMTKLSNLYKENGDQQDPNNWHRICLKEMSAKIVSIITAKRLLLRLKNVRITYQFRHIGCQEAIHLLRSAVMLCCHHGLKSYVLYVDLVKTFNSIQHSVFFEILKKYSLPISLIDVIRKLYENCHVQLELRTALKNVPYETGVQ